jgi:hypothetical protein
MIEQQQVNAFADLFQGNERSFGQWSPETRKMSTEKAKISKRHFAGHLNGKMGVGVVPVGDDGAVWFAAIDIDNHGQEGDLDIIALEAKVQQLSAPVIPCRSKSGGIHVYLFGSEPLRATKVREYLVVLSASLGYTGAEIFPKQTALRVFPVGRQFGNWINLPYFNAKDTERPATVNGRVIDLDYFLERAQELRVSANRLDELTASEYPGVPPCVQRMLTGADAEIAQSMRNQGLYNISIYLKRAFPDQFRNRAHDANIHIFNDPLPHDEADKTIRSATRRDYTYKCKEEPCASLCDREVCLTREHGISPKESNGLADVELPEMVELVKYTTDPVKWSLRVSGVEVYLQTSTLLQYPRFREAMAERLTKLLPSIKQRDWEGLLTPLMESARVVEAPDDASTGGVVRERLNAFIAKASVTAKGPGPRDREHLLRGKPVIQMDGDERLCLFRATDFIDYLRKNRSEDLKGANLWFALRKMGCTHRRVRVEQASGNQKVIQAWCVPWDPEGNANMGIEPLTLVSEF